MSSVFANGVYAFVAIGSLFVIAHLVALSLYGSVVIYEESRIICALEIVIVTVILLWNLGRLGVYRRVKKMHKEGSLLLICVLLLASLLALLPAPANAQEYVNLFVNGAGDETNIDSQEPDSGAHWEKVDENPAPDGDGTYVYTSNAGWQRDFYNLQDFRGVGTVASFTVLVYAKSDTGSPDQPSLKVAIKSGTGGGAPDTASEGDEETPGATYDYYSERWNTNPATGSAWTWDEIENLQVGVSLREAKTGVETRVTQFYCYVGYYPTKPTVVTSAATSVEETTAVLNGAITDVGGANCTQRGYDWGLTAGYGTSWTESAPPGTGSFSHGIDSLAPGTLYHFRAKARNAGGWGYGSDLTFTTKPNAPTDLTTSNPTINSIDLDWTKGTGATHTMIRRKTDSYPGNVTDGAQAYYGTASSTTDSGLPGNTTQFYRGWSYRDPNYSDNYSQATEATYDTLTVSTLATTAMATTTATFNGQIHYYGCSVVSYGFDWGHTETATWSTTVMGTFYPGLYSRDITGLETDDIYYCRFRADDCEGRTYGNWTAFITAQPDYTAQEDIDNTVIPDVPDEPGGWIRPPKDWGEIGVGDATIPLTFFFFLCIVALLIPTGLILTKFTKNLGVLFMVLGFILGILSIYPRGGYLDWWVMFPYLIVGIALIMKEQQIGWS